MEPGRELDNFIAEKVLGWKFSQSSFEQYEPGSWYKNGKKVWESSFNPSTNVAHIGQVIEKMKEFPYSKNDSESIGEIRFTWSKGLRLWIVRPWNDRFNDYASESLPHAICLAALDAYQG